LVAELRRVRQEVEHHLDHAVEVRNDRRHVLRQASNDLDVPFLEDLAHGGQRIGDHVLHVDRRLRPLGLARFDLGEIEHLVDETRQALGFLRDDAEEFLPLAELDVGVVEQDLGERADRRERRAQLVRHRRDEIVLQPVELLQPLVRFPQLGRSPPRARATSARAGGCRRRPATPRPDVAHLLDGERLLLDHGGDHDARRGAAHRARKLDFDVVHELGIRHERRTGPRHALGAA
jgi:hypothetical protein